MKLATFCIAQKPHSYRLGVVENDKIIDLAAAADLLDKAPHQEENMKSWLDSWPDSQERAAELLNLLKETEPDHPSLKPPITFPLKDVVLAAPLKPLSIRDYLCFEKHMAQSTRAMASMHYPALARMDRITRRIFGRGFINVRRQWYRIPLYYKGNPQTVIGPGEDIIQPEYTKMLDYELEFAAVIGKRGKNIPSSQAQNYIAGFTIFNDVSARDVQFDEIMGGLGPTKSKDFDTGNVFGPYLVTTDEIRDPYSLEMTARVNGEVWSRGNSRNMHYRFEDLIAYTSRDETLYPGDVLGSGTVGDGSGLELGRFLNPGDVIELEVEKIGVLRNKVAKK